MPLDSQGNYYCDGALQRLAVDFDGVLYPGGMFENDSSFEQGPITGAIPWLIEMAEHYECLIYTSRMCSEPHTAYSNMVPKSDVASLIRSWLFVNGVPPELLYVDPRIIVYPNKYGKPSCKAYVDDHAVAYNGGRHPRGPFEVWWRR